MTNLRDTQAMDEERGPDRADFEAYEHARAGTRLPLPASLARCDAKELTAFLRRAVREGDRREASSVYEEMQQRGFYLKRPDYHAYRRLIGGK
jgi:pentatricopeptide repeat protein